MSTVLDTLISTADTSAESYARMAPKTLARRQQEVFDVVVELQREGADDVSRREIQARYERTHNKRIDMSSVASSVHALVLAKRLQAPRTLRPCLVTGRDISPVFAVAQQAALIN